MINERAKARANDKISVHFINFIHMPGPFLATGDVTIDCFGMILLASNITLVLNVQYK